MKYVIAICVSFLLIMLQACGGETTNTDIVPTERASLHFSYPYPGQQQVPITAPLVLRLSAPLMADAVADVADALLLTHLESGADMAITVTLADGNQSLVIRPVNAMVEADDYRLSLVSELETTHGDIASLGTLGLTFRTAGYDGGSKRRSGEGAFSLLSVSPRDNPLATLPFVDFSTLRLTFNYAVTAESTRYGSHVRLENALGELVPAHLLVKGRFLSVDPISDLNADERYTLRLVDIESVYGDQLSVEVSDLIPASTLPRERLVLKVGSEQSVVTSGLTGEPINNVPVRSLLLGDESFTALAGDIAAELGFVPNFPDAVPLRIRRASLLRGSDVAINLIGEVPAGIESGDISVTFLSDANGYLLENPYGQTDNAPRYVLLSMDIAMSAEHSEANGALSQSLLQVQLVGVSTVKNGVLVMDAVGVVEPELLGLERASGLLSFHLEGYADQDAAMMPAPDNTPLLLQSWSPGENYLDRARPGDPIVLNFSKALSSASVTLNGALVLSQDGVPFADGEVDLEVDGASIVIEPPGGLRHNVDYSLSLTSLLTDTNGNALAEDYNLNIRLADFSDVNLRSPIPVSVYPGFPCALVDAMVIGNSSSWRNGRCRGGRADDPLYPIPALPSDRGIDVLFSRSMDLDSIVLGQTFVVERRDAGLWLAVPGRLDKSPQRVQFYPDETWRTGDLYRYTLKSNGDHQSSAAICAVEAICSTDGLPLQTQQLAQTVADITVAQGGGADLTNYFQPVSSADSTLVSLRALPGTDTNANLIHEPQFGELAPVVDATSASPDGLRAPPNHLRLALDDLVGAATDLNIGCSFGESCPEKHYVYALGAMQTEITGYDDMVVVVRPTLGDSVTGAVTASILPTALYTTGVFLDVDILAGFATISLDTNTLMLRLRHQKNSADERLDLISAYITESAQGPWLTTTFDLLIDAPALAPTAGTTPLLHDLHSKAVDTVVLEGPLRFIEDGRLVANVSNPFDVPVSTTISFDNTDLADIYLKVPAGGIQLDLTVLPIK
jgi:Big-like domain-containing protein